MYDYDRTRTASDTLASYYESFVTTLVDAFVAAMGSWQVTKVTMSNTELTGGFMAVSNKEKFTYVSGYVECTGTAVHITANVTLGGSTEFKEKAGGSVHVGANDMGRNLAHLINQKITRLNPAAVTVR